MCGQSYILVKHDDLCVVKVFESNWILYRPVNGREISSSVFGKTRRTRLYVW